MTVVFSSSLISCGGHVEAGHEVYFLGSVYDGWKGLVLPEGSYEIELHTNGKNKQVHQAKIGPEGDYVIGPIPPEASYRVRIEAEGYHTLVSSNNAAGLVSPKRRSQDLLFKRGSERMVYTHAYLMPQSESVVDDDSAPKASDRDGLKRPLGQLWCYDHAVAKHGASGSDQIDRKLLWQSLIKRCAHTFSPAKHAVNAVSRNAHD